MEHADAAVWHTLRPENAAAPMLEKDGKGAAAFKLWAKGLGPRAVGASKLAKNGLGELVAPKLDKDGKGAVTAPKLEKSGKGAAAPTLDAWARKKGAAVAAPPGEACPAATNAACRTEEP